MPVVRADGDDTARKRTHALQELPLRLGGDEQI